MNKVAAVVALVAFAGAALAADPCSNLLIGVPTTSTFSSTQVDGVSQVLLSGLLPIQNVGQESAGPVVLSNVALLLTVPDKKDPINVPLNCPTGQSSSNTVYCSYSTSVPIPSTEKADITKPVATLLGVGTLKSGPKCNGKPYQIMHPAYTAQIINTNVNNYVAGVQQSVNDYVNNLMSNIFG